MKPNRRKFGLQREGLSSWSRCEFKRKSSVFLSVAGTVADIRYHVTPHSTDPVGVLLLTRQRLQTAGGLDLDAASGQLSLPPPPAFLSGAGPGSCLSVLLLLRRGSEQLVHDDRGLVAGMV